MERKTLDYPPFSPFFFFPAALLAKDLAQEEALSDQHIAALEGVWLTKNLHSLQVDS